jgi:pyrroline-5-carboxylate reductase
MSEERREWVRTILRSVGEVVEVPEPLQDVVTAVSGSGPGFLFYLAQHWIAAGVDQGLDERTARLLVTETMAGAAEVLRQRSDSPEELVRKVATPGGTTEAGLKVLQEANLAQIMKNTVDSATRRSRELNESAG